MPISTPRLASRIAAASLAAVAGAALLAGSLPTPPAHVFAATHADRAAGQALFHEKGCEHCHGVNGIGGEKGPALSSVGRKLKPAAIAKQIHNGGDAMPPFGDVLAPDEIQHLVDWLSVQKAKPLKSSSQPIQPTAPKPSTGGSDDQ